MSSGMGVRGTVGRCYGFFADYKQCQETFRGNAKTSMREQKEGRKEGCYKEREDYFECLHSKKEYARVNEVLKEKKRQEMEAAGY